MPPSKAEAPGVTEKLCQWIHQTTFESVPDSVKERAKYLILDGIACGLVGAHVPWSEDAFNAIRQFEARGQHPIIGYNEVNHPSLSIFDSYPPLFAGLILLQLILTVLYSAIRSYYCRPLEWHIHPSM